MTTHTGPQGRTATSHSEVTRSEDGFVRESSQTGPNGGVRTVESQGVWDPVTQTWTREKTVTRPDGSTVQTEATATGAPDSGVE